MRRTALLATALAMVAPLLATAPAGADESAVPKQVSENAVPAQVKAPVPDLAWHRCNGLPGFYRCANAKVPLDYDRPRGRKVTINLLKDPADQPAQKTGSLFVNPGGPGGSATEFALTAGELFDKRVRNRFDIIGIDPRGVGNASLMRCRTPEKAPGVPRALVYPRTVKTATKVINHGNWMARTCRRNPDPVVNHMSTADTARDMDLIRQAVGDRRLTYYGVSYGSYLGSTYAAMFPRRIRAMIVDSVLDPRAWATGRGNGAKVPFTRRLGSGIGGYRAIGTALSECNKAGRGRCVLAGRSWHVYNDVTKYLAKRPIKIDGFPLTYDQFHQSVNGMMYDPGAYSAIMRFLDRLHTAAYGGKQERAALSRSDIDPATVKADNDHPFPGPYTGTGWGQVTDSGAGVSCADTTNPSTPWTWWRQARQAENKAPGFGPLWTWNSVSCAHWPKKARADRFTGPWRTRTSTPLLIANNLQDPATPVNGARAVHDLFGGSRLITVRNWGHGAIGSGDCVDDRYSAYLLDQKLPRRDTVRCLPRKNIF